MREFFFCFFLASCSLFDRQEDPRQKKAAIHYSFGTTNLIEKNYTEALDNLLKAAQLDPEDSKIQNNLGMAYYFKGDYQRAMEHIRKAMDLDEQNLDAPLNYASILYQLERYDESEKYYKQITKELTYKGQFRAYYNLGLIALKKGDPGGAMDQFKRAVQENSQYCPAHYSMGSLYEENQQFSKAYEAYRKSYQGTCVNNPLPHFRAALMLKKKGDIPGARMKFFEVMENFPATQFSIQAKNELKSLGHRGQSVFHYDSKNF